MKIGNTIKTLRTAAGIRQAALADRIGVTASYLSLIESDTREPSLTILKNISKALDVPVSVLIFEGEEPPSGSSKEQAEEYERIQDLTMQVLRRMLSRTNTASNAE